MWCAIFYYSSVTPIISLKILNIMKPCHPCHLPKNDTHILHQLDHRETVCQSSSVIALMVNLYQMSHEQWQYFYFLSTCIGICFLCEWRSYITIGEGWSFCVCICNNIAGVDKSNGGNTEEDNIIIIKENTKRPKINNSRPKSNKWLRRPRRKNEPSRK